MTQVNEVIINQEISKFLTRNLLGHEPCHDFKPSGKRLATMNERFKSLIESNSSEIQRGGAPLTDDDKNNIIEDINDIDNDYGLSDDSVNIVEDFMGLGTTDSYDVINKYSSLTNLTGEPTMISESNDKYLSLFNVVPQNMEPFVDVSNIDITSTDMTTLNSIHPMTRRSQVRLHHEVIASIQDINTQVDFTRLFILGYEGNFNIHTSTSNSVSPPTSVFNPIDSESEPQWEGLGGRDIPRDSVDVLTQSAYLQTNDAEMDTGIMNKEATDAATTDAATTYAATTYAATTDAATTDAITRASSTDDVSTDDANTDDANTDDANTDDANTDDSNTDANATHDVSTDDANTDDATTDANATDDVSTDADTTDATDTDTITITSQPLDEKSVTNEEVTDDNSDIVTDYSNQYAEMKLILQGLIDMFEETINTELGIDEDIDNPDVKLGVKNMQSVIRFYHEAFDYYTTNINNTLPTYMINNSYFIKDALTFYFIDLLALNTYESQSQLLSLDTVSKNALFDNIYKLRVPDSSSFQGFNNKISLQPVDNKSDDDAVITDTDNDGTAIMKGGTKDVTLTHLINISIDNISLVEENELPQPDVTGDRVSICKEIMLSNLDAVYSSINDQITEYAPENISEWNKIKAIVEKVVVNQWNRSSGSLTSFLKRNRSGWEQNTITILNVNILTKGISKLRSEINKFKIIFSDIITTPGESSKQSVNTEGRTLVNKLLLNVCAKVAEVVPFSSSNTNQNIFTEQARIINKVAAGGSLSTIDDDLFNTYVNYVKNDYASNTQIYKKRENYTDIPMTYTSGESVINIINNALTTTISSGSKRKIVDELKDNKNRNVTIICPITSILDAQGGFGSCTKGKQSNNYMGQNMNVVISDDGTSVNTNFKFTMTLNSNKKTGKTVLEYTLSYNDFLMSTSTVETVIKNGILNILSANNTFEDALEYIEIVAKGSPSVDFDAIFQNKTVCKEVMRIMSRKYMGDFGQELTAIVKNGGFNTDTQIPSEFRMNNQHIILADGDRPSFVRSGILMLGANSDNINARSSILYMSGKESIFIKKNGQFGKKNGQFGTRRGGKRMTRKPRVKKSRHTKGTNKGKTSKKNKSMKRVKNKNKKSRRGKGRK